MSMNMAARRALAATKGLCSTCAAHPVTPGYKTCAECLIRRAAYYADKTWCCDCQRGDGRHRHGCVSTPSIARTRAA